MITKRSRLKFIFVFVIFFIGGFYLDNQFETVKLSALCATACTGCPQCCENDCSSSQCQVLNTLSPCSTSCRSKTTCSDGSTTCGGCPAAPPPAPPPGSPPGTPAPPPAPPGCTATTPAAAPVQLTPANGATGLSNAVQFTWSPIAANQWGVGCPQTNGYYIYYAQTVDGGGVSTCAALTYSYAYRALVTSAALNLNWGKTYCWRLGAFNGSASRLSGFRTLTVNFAPTLTSSGFTSVDVCGNGRSGAAGQSGVTNPVTYSLTYTDPDSNDTFKEIWLAFLINTYTAANYTELQVHPAAHTNKTVAMKIDLATGRAYTINATSNWDTGALSGNLSNADASATIMDIGTVTVGSISGNTATATFSIRFDSNFPANALTIHAAALMQAPNGTLFTSGATGAAPRRYSKVAGTWFADVKKPAATLSGPAYQSNGSFNITWSASDVVGLTGVYSYIYSDVDGSQVKNNTNNIITTTPGSPIGYPGDPPNAGITAANLGVKNYTILTPGNFANYTFSIYAVDAACNNTTTNTASTSASPWIMGTGGDISGIGGIDRVKVPTINSFTLPPYVTTTTPAFFSNYGAISGTETNANGNISNFDQFVNNYNDNAMSLPNGSGTLWYDYLLDKFTKNGITSLTTLTGPKTILTTMSSGLVATPNTKVAVKIAGDLTIGAVTSSVATCDLEAIVFVEGNLVINPDFTITPPPITNPNYNGCMFVVKGNTTIGTGTVKTSVLLSSATPASYDNVNALIVTDGTFSTPPDTGAPDNGQGTWTVGTAGGTAKYGYGGVAVGNKLYYWAGVAVGSVYTNAMSIYDTATNTWSVGTAGGNTKVYFATGTDGTKIYYWGGLISGTITNTMNIYNTATNTWSLGAVGPAGREGAFGATANGKFYVWGGWNGSAYVNTLNIYDMATNTWTTGAAGGTPKGISSQGVVFNNKIYFAGGCITNNACSVVTNNLSIYDIGTNTWSVGAVSPAARGNASAVLQNSKLFLIGGYNAAYVATVYVYDFGTNTWTTGTPLPAARGAFSAVTLGGRVYAWGGYNGAFLNTLNYYTSPSDANKLDGLYINGGIISNNTMNGTNTALARNINSIANDQQPALIFNLDPRYKLTFSDDFASRDYSIREFGL